MDKLLVYAVIHSSTDRISNDACWDDGYYDDYYETEITSEEIINLFRKEEDANALAEKLNNNSGCLDEYFVTEYEVI